MRPSQHFTRAICMQLGAIVYHSRLGLLCTSRHTLCSLQQEQRCVYLTGHIYAQKTHMYT